MYQEECGKISVFYKELKPIFWSLRFMGLFPYSISEEGEFYFSIRSPLTLYSVFMVTTTVIASVFVQIHGLLRLAGSGEFTRNSYMYSTIVFFLPVFISPLTHWVEIQRRIQLFNALICYEKQFKITTGKNINLNLKCYVMTLLTLATLITGYVVINMIIVEHLEYWKYIPLTYATSLYFLLPVIWFILCLSLERSAKSLAHEMKNNVQNNASGRDTIIIKYRMMWLILNEMLKQLGTSVGLTYGAHTLILLAITILFSFLLILNMGTNADAVVADFIGALLLSCVIYIQCNSAQRATDAVSTEFNSHVQEVDNTIFFDDKVTKREIQSFLVTITNQKSDISLYGFVSVNRSLVTSFASTLVTYLVVLRQFQIGARTSHAYNSTEV